MPHVMVCPQCNKPFRAIDNRRVYCSRKCSSSARAQVKITIDEFKERLKTKSATEIAEELGVLYGTLMNWIGNQGFQISDLKPVVEMPEYPTPDSYDKR
jgi:hypothetical protein